uniref:PiggyBac transposable element-derived protein domain-containing protein n=1 Tax=Poecilia mexicana TaxID=48701 RepID=A0A3B3X2J9_9TELE
MRLAESEDELEQLQTDGDSESDSSRSSLDEDYTWEGRRTCRKKVNNATTPKNRSSTRNSRKRLFNPGRNTQSRKRQRRDLGPDKDGDDGDRWRNIDEEDAEPPQARFRPQRDVGPQLNRTASYTPLELFQLFFTTTVIDTLVRNTNTYGEKKCQSQRESWVPVTAADMYSYICLVLYMGIVPLKTLKEFWRGSTLFSLPFPASVMPCRRFLAISRSLHMNDPAKEAANDQKKGTLGYDRLFKIKPLYEQILEACHTHFHPHQHISIDERMVASKARFGFKQYSRNKPTKWGFKLYVLADSICGYTLNFFVYVGKDGEPTGKGISYDAVMRLLNIPFLGKGYKLYVDNFYTSPALFLDLLKRKIWACGTIRSNIAGYPKEKNNMPDKTPRGTIRWIRKGDLLFVKWFDTREVTMCTTMHKAYSNDMAKRKVKNKDGQWTVKHVPIPGCVKDYNKHMGGVDLSDALIGYYNVLHKTQRWYKTLFYHFVDIATVNAFILHKEMCKMQNRPTGTQKLFREKLILSLAQIVPPSSSSDAVNRATAGRRSCVVCKRKSPVYCSTCHKTLCFTTLRNCYSKWHRSNNICV